MPVLVLPLHGHLAPAAWAAAQAAPGLQGRLRADRRAARCRARSAATSPSCASAACSAATSPPRPPTAASTRRSRSPAPSTPPPRARLGRGARRPRPGHHRLRHTELGHGGMAALDSAHAALALGLPTLLSPRLSAPTRASATRPSATTPYTVLELLLGRGRRRRSQRATPMPLAEPGDRRGWPPPPARQHRATSTATRPRACRPDDGPDARRGPALLRRAARRRPCRPRRRHAACGPRVEARPARTTPPWQSPSSRQSRGARRAGAGARFEGLVLDFLSYLELERGLSRNTLNAYRTDLLQYGEFLAAHDLDALAARPADVADFLAELATGEGRPPARPRRSTARPPACAPSTSTCAATS